MKKSTATLLAVLAFTLSECHPEPSAPEFLNYGGLIDIHAHIGRFRGYDLSLQNLLQNMKENHVDYAMISNIDGAAVPGFTADEDEMSINNETARVVSENPQLIPLAWARPGARNSSAANIEFFLKEKHFAGIKFHPDFNHFDIEAPQVAPYLELCRKYHVPALIHCGSEPHEPNAVYRLARKFPEVAFVLYHSGWGTDHSEAIDAVLSAKEKKDGLIFLETAQMKAADVLRAVQKAGADRVIFGTDATYYGRYHYSHYSEMLKRLQQSLTPEDFQKVIHDNAAALFSAAISKNAKAANN